MSRLVNTSSESIADEKKASWIWKVISCTIGLVGLYLMFLFFHLIYHVFVLHTRVFFSFLGYPILLILGFLFIQTPFLVFLKHGSRARIQTSACGVLASIIIGFTFLPMLFMGDLNDFEDDFLNAVWDGETETVVQMLNDGEDPNKQDYYGNNPMTLASYAGQTETAKILLERGADVQSSDGSMPPLHCAAYRGHTETVTFLLANGADPMATNRYGETAYEVAKRKEFPEVAALLRLTADHEAHK